MDSVHETLRKADAALAAAEEHSRWRQEAGLDIAEPVVSFSAPVPAPARQRAAPAVPVVWASQAWVSRQIDIYNQLLGDMSGELRAEERDYQAKEIAQLEARIAARIEACEASVTELLSAQEKQIADLQRRLAEAERRAGPSRPRLIASHHDDSAA